MPLGAKHLAACGVGGMALGFASGFSVAENLYASEDKKNSMRKLARLAAAAGLIAVLATAFAGQRRA